MDSDELSTMSTGLSTTQAEFSTEQTNETGCGGPLDPSQGCESIAETSQVSTKMLPPGGSCHGAAIGGAMTDEEFGR